MHIFRKSLCNLQILTLWKCTTVSQTTFPTHSGIENFCYDVPTLPPPCYHSVSNSAALQVSASLCYHIAIACNEIHDHAHMQARGNHV